MTQDTNLITQDQRLRVCTVTEISVETPTIKTFYFEDDMVPKPGQFVMVWLPGVDEVPMSVSYTGSKKGITVAKVGETTARMHELKTGAQLGIRGPYGNGFDITGAKRILAVAGGCGSAPIGPVLDAAAHENIPALFVLGARTESDLLFKNRARNLGIELDISTDDGSAGHHGFVTERVSKILASESVFDLIVTCGPEPMLKKVVGLAIQYNVKVQVSLERYMKCGVGVCDACAINGYQVCRDGPVFDGELLAKLSEFGNSRRDPSGRLIEV